MVVMVPQVTTASFFKALWFVFKFLISISFYSLETKARHDPETNQKLQRCSRLKNRPPASQLETQEPTPFQGAQVTKAKDIARAASSRSFLPSAPRHRVSKDRTLHCHSSWKQAPFTGRAFQNTGT